MKPEHLEGKSLNGSKINLDALYKIAPSCFTETKDPKTGEIRHTINFTTLRELLGDDAVEDADEMYQFTWPGKQEARRDAASPITDTLRPAPEESVNWDTTKNLYIEGNNLPVLKLLQKGYMGKIKMMYLDPPYNTGHDFLYQDDYSRTQEEEDLLAGITDEEGNKFRKNLKTNGRFHSVWCSMLYSCLLECRSLLTDDGVIFISIDQNELDNTKKIASEVFGASNYITDLVWSGGRKNDSKYISVSHEYVVCFFKNADYVFENKIVWREKKRGLSDIYKEYDSLKKQYGKDIKTIEKELKLWYKNLPDGHPAKDHKHYSSVDYKGIYFPSDISWPGGGGPKYQVLHPTTHKPVTIPSRGWITSEDNLKEWIKEDLVDFGDDETSVPTLKAYLKEKEYSVPYSVFYQDGRAASKRLAKLMGEKVFENPKDEEILQRFIEFCGLKDDDIILDFFSGSASTAHATFLANVNKGMKCKFIMVQIPQEITMKGADSEKAQKVAQSAINLCDKLGVPHTICEIGKERIRRAGKQIKEKAGDKARDLDIGFRVFKLSDSNFKDVYFAPKDVSQESLDLYTDNIKQDRSDMDLLFGAMLDWGVQLDMPMTTDTVDDCKVYTVNGGDLVACFAPKITEGVVKAIAAKKPLRVLFRDSCFDEDDSKINIFEDFKQMLDWSEEEAIKNIRVI